LGDADGVKPWIARLFSDDEEVIAVLKIFFVSVPIGYLGVALMMVTSSILSALHKTSLSLLLHFGRLFGIVLPIAWSLGWAFGLQGFLLGIGIGHFISALVVFALVNGWIRNQTLDRILNNT
jgi:Na+-driven multidrug efflux pump